MKYTIPFELYCAPITKNPEIARSFLKTLDIERLASSSFLDECVSKPKPWVDTTQKCVQRPEFAGNMAEIVEVAMKEQAVTIATDAKPVLATYGLGPCVSLVGYEPSAKVGFLTHYVAGTDISSSFTTLLTTLYGMGLSDAAPTRFEVRLVTASGEDDELIRELKTLVRHGTRFNMEIVEEDTGYTPDGKSVALDTRTGELFSYDPMKNPNSKIPDELAILQMLFPGEAELVYRPK